jgi:hypothetical protein
VSTRVAEPPNRDAIALGDSVARAWTDRLDDPDAFVARDERKVGLDRPVAVGGVDVGVTKTRRFYTDEDLALAGRRRADFFDL